MPAALAPLPRPPVAEDERIDWLRFLHSRRVGVVTFMRLLREHGSAWDALHALPGIARAAGSSRLYSLLRGRPAQ